MRYQGLRITADILFRVFWIGFAFLMLAWLWFMLMHQYWYHLLVNQWQLGSSEFLNMLVISFFAMAKFVLFFYVLIPALAIRWTLRKLDKNPL